MMIEVKRKGWSIFDEMKKTYMNEMSSCYEWWWFKMWLCCSCHSYPTNEKIKKLKWLLLVIITQNKSSSEMNEWMIMMADNYDDRKSKNKNKNKPDRHSKKGEFQMRKLWVKLINPKWMCDLLWFYLISFQKRDFPVFQ